MRVVTNRVDTEHVRSVTENGREFLVAPVVLVRSMWLNGPKPDGPDVYLPQSEVKQSTDRWADIPSAIGHPTAGEKPISIHDDRADVPVVAQVRDPAPTESKGSQAVAGKLWVDVAAAEAAGRDGQRVVTRLRNGDAIEVSSGYAPGAIVSGQFDGEHRDLAAVDIQPDHVAILPNTKGKCSLADGCGAGAPMAPAANQVFVNLTDDPISPESGPGEDPGSREDRTDGMDDDQTPFERLGRKVAESLGIANVNEQEADEPAESGTGGQTNPIMGDKTTELVENHGFEAENLPAEDTECFGRIYEAITANEGEATGESETDAEQTTTETTKSGGDGFDADAFLDKIEERFVTSDDLSDAVGEALAANREHEAKADLAADVVANSDEYDDAEAVLEDYPTKKALRSALDSLTQSTRAHYGGQRGARVSANTDGSDAPSPVASVRAKQLAESDD